MRQHSTGVSLAQSLIALSLIGVIASISITLLMGRGISSTDRQDEIVSRKITNDIENLLALKQAQDGIITQNESPAEIISQSLKGVSGITTITTTHDLPSNCQLNLPVKKITTINNNWDIYVDSNWHVRQNQRDSANYCIKKQNSEKSLIAKIYRTNNKVDHTHRIASSNIGNNTLGNNNVLTNTRVNGYTDTNLTANINGIASTEIDIPKPPNPVAWEQEVAIFGRQDGGGVGSAKANDYLFNHFFTPEQWATFHTQGTQSGFEPSFYSQDGVLIRQLRLNDLWPNLSFIMEDDTVQDYQTRYNSLLPAEKELRAFYNTNDESTVITHPAGRIHYLLDNFRRMPHIDQKMWGNEPKLKHALWTDPVTKKVFRIGAGQLRHSPVKINLKGKDAVIDEQNKFNLDVDGLATNSFPVMKTSGGVSNDEAWLVLDRGQAGFSQNGVVDGDDLFGDHLGKYPSGYEDLTETFKYFIHVDNKGKRYLDLTPLPWWEQLWINILRFFGMAKEANPAMDLKLLKNTGQAITASDVLKRIDLDYKNVKEFDEKHKNAIFQRANVTFIDGTVASSADQWFKPILFFQAEELKTP